MDTIATISSPVLEVPLPTPATERLGALFDAHQGRLYALAVRMSRDPEEARDLLQETFLRAARRPGSIPEKDGAAHAWLVRVLVNLCRDRWRRLKVRRNAGPPPAWSNQAPADPEATADARDAVRAALARLRPRTRAVVVLHEFEGLEAAEIARQLKIREATVRWHVATGRSRLRAELGARREDP